MGRIGREGSVLEQEGRKGGHDAPSSSLGLFEVGGANRGEPHNHMPFPLKEGRVDQQLTRNCARFEVRGKD